MPHKAGKPPNLHYAVSCERDRDSHLRYAVPHEPDGAALDEGPQVAGRQLQHVGGPLGAARSAVQEVLQQPVLVIVRAHARPMVEGVVAEVLPLPLHTGSTRQSAQAFVTATQREPPLPCGPGSAAAAKILVIVRAHARPMVEGVVAAVLQLPLQSSGACWSEQAAVAAGCSGPEITHISACPWPEFLQSPEYHILWQPVLDDFSSVLQSQHLGQRGGLCPTGELFYVIEGWSHQSIHAEGRYCAERQTSHCSRAQQTSACCMGGGARGLITRQAAVSEGFCLSRCHERTRMLKGFELSLMYQRRLDAVQWLQIPLCAC